MEQPVAIPEFREKDSVQLQARLARKASALELAGRLASGQDIRQSLPDVIMAAQQITGVGSLRVVVDGDGESLAFGAGPDAEDMAAHDAAVGALLPPDMSSTGVFGNGTQLASGDSAIQAALVAAWPLIVDRERVGYLWVGSAEAITLADTDREFIADLAAQIAPGWRRARAAQEIQRGWKWLAAILDIVTIPIIAIRRDGRESLLNAAARSLLGLESAEVADQPIQAVLKDHPELLRLFRGRGQRVQEDEWQTKDGRTFIPQILPVTADTGEVTGLVLVLHDATTLKALNRSQQQYIELVAHDVRSPLTVMQGYADLIGKVGTINEEQTFFVEKILSGVQQITALVDNIQDAGRWDPQTGVYEINREPVDLTRIVKTIMSNHQELAQKNHLTMVTEIAPNVPVVNVDTMMIERALVNLLTNAIKYSPDGGEIKVSMEVKNQKLVICVSDTGIGIAPEYHDQIFNRGTRVDNKEVSRRKIRGSGLGLFIVRSVARRHGGEAYVESELEQGSRFYFTIPLEGPNLLGGA